MMILLWFSFGFLAGSIPFSLIIGKLLAKKDIRAVGDGNPGGVNALKAGGLLCGIPAILLDILKGFLPVFLAQKYGLGGWSLLPVCLAPVLGHAFSPFLRFHGGKALGATGGVWVALIGLWAFPIFASLSLPITLIETEDAWSVGGGMLALIFFSLLTGPAWLVAFAALNTALIVWTHRHDLAHLPKLRPWVTRIFERRHA